MRQIFTVILFCAGLFCLAQAQVPQTGAGLGVGSSCNPSPPTTSCMTVPSGLVGWWSLDNSETSGTTTNDTSGNANNGTSTNTPTTGATGQIQQAFTFAAASSQWITIGTPAVLNFNSGSAFSLTAWVNFTTNSATNDIFTKGFDGTNTQYEFGINSGNHLFFTTFNGSTHGVTSANTISSGFKFVVGTFDGSSTWNLYVNGSLDTGPTTDSVSMQHTAEPVYIAAVAVNAGQANWFNGSIDDMRVYNRVLSSTEVSQIYNSGLAGKP